MHTDDGIWVWMGTRSNNLVEKWALDTSIKYAEKSSEIPSDAPILVTEKGKEPEDFTMHFHKWKATNNSDKVRQEDGRTLLSEYLRDCFSYEELAKPVDSLPKAVDPTRKEFYLSNEEFEQVFNMTKQKYETMRPWRRNKLKKKVGLY